MSSKSTLGAAVDHRLQQGPASFEELMRIAFNVIPPSRAIRERRLRVSYIRNRRLFSPNIRPIHPELERLTGVREILRTTLHNNKRRGKYENLPGDIWRVKDKDTHATL